MKRLLLGSFVLGVAAQSQALVWGFSVPIIDGGQQVPPTSSAAYGSGSFTIDDQTWVVTGSMSTTGLPFRTAAGGPNVTGAHLHEAPAGSNGPVVFDLLANELPGLPMDLAGGITLYAWSGVLNTGNNAAVLADFIANNGYINIHTNAFPGGEIRGQIHCEGAVPEPATIATLSIGALALIRRRRR
jgi:hypothetical protein